MIKSNEENNEETQKRISRDYVEKILARVLLVLYLVLLIWLVLFKLQFNILSVFNYNHRSLNLNPFNAPLKTNGRINFGEMIDNVIIFIPFGLFFSVNFKKARFLPKLAIIFGFSIVCELIQYIFAIGATDILDVITNTLGGFLGLELYNLLNKFVNNKKLDRVIIFVGILLLLILIYYRVHVLRLRY